MRGAIRIATFAGIGVYVHWTFWLILLWVVFLYGDQGLGAILRGVALILAVFACVVLHEFGHALTARRFGVRTRDITLLPIGGVARLERMPENPIQEFLVAIAGPAVNVAIALVLAIVLIALGAIATSADVLMNAGAGFLNQLLWINIALVLFNMIPAFPMDGGRILRAFLAMLTDYARATRIAARVGQIIAVGFAILGILVNPFLLLIAFFVYIGAQQEVEMATMRVSLTGLPVRDAMMTDFRTLAPEDSVADAVTLLLDVSQTEFPVFENAAPIGILTRDDILRAVSQGHSGHPVRAVMHQPCPTVDENHPVDRIVAKMRSDSIPAVVITRAGQPVGLLTMDNVLELVMIHGAQQRTT